MAIEVEAPRISTKESPRQILLEDFKETPELPIRGGWGYVLEEAVIIDKPDPIVANGLPFRGVGLEYVFVEKRIYEELIIFKPVGRQHSGIRWNRLTQQTLHLGGRQYDHLTFEVTALRDADWAEFKAEFEGQNGTGSQGFDRAEHFARRDAKTIRYVTDYWFDITSFF